MIRIEYSTKPDFGPANYGATCEGTLAEAKAFVAGMAKAGVVVVYANYYDNDSRVDHIRNGDLDTLDDTPSLA